MNRAAMWLVCLGALAYRVEPRHRQVPPISAENLRSRLTAFAHDSMRGRMTGTLFSKKATDFIIAGLTRGAVAPMGERGQYDQIVPVRLTQIDLPNTRLSENYSQHFDRTSPSRPPGIGMLPLTGAFGLATPRNARVPKEAVRDTTRDKGDSVVFSGYLDVVIGGRIGDPSAIDPKKVNGKIVLFLPPVRSNGQPDYQLWSVRDQLAAYKGAAAIFLPTLDLMPRSFIASMTQPQMELAEHMAQLPAIPPVLAMSTNAEEYLTRRADTDGWTMDLAAIFYESRVQALAVPARNIVAVVEGSDPRLKSEFVVLSAHLDHLGVAKPSDRVSDDSIYNGADDGGTGSIALLAIAEHIAAMPVKPKRSILFLWTVAEEQGLLGAEYFTDKPTVPRDKIVANITIDMIGRGGVNDIAGGGPAYLEVAGAHRLSGEFANWIAETNRRAGSGLQLAPTMIADSLRHEYCDGDDWHFNRWSIPSTRISTGRHADFHQVTDDVSKIDFEKYARVTQLIEAIAEDIANRPDRPRLDKPKPDPRRACVR